jgi:hypothetical protein
MKQDTTSQFETIVHTLLSSVPVEPRIIREHIARYAKDTGLPYDLAKNAVVLVVKDRLQKKLSKI